MKFTIIVENFNTALKIDRARHKIIKKMKEPNNTINQLNLIHIQNTPPNNSKYTFFSSAQGTYTEVDHMLSHKQTSNLE